MSHCTTVRTQIMERDALVKALAYLGFPRVEAHENAEHLHG